MSKITKELISDEQRIEAPPKAFGSLMLEFEFGVYAVMSNLYSDYNGGSWRCYDLSNGGFLMVLAENKPIQIENAMNGFNGEMGSEAASIGVNLIVLSRLTQRPGLSPALLEKLLFQHEALSAFAKQHAEAKTIEKLTD